MVDEAGIQLRYEALDPVLDERSRRRFAAVETRAAGRRGVSSVSRITGLARSTIIRGLAELYGDAAYDATYFTMPRRANFKHELFKTLLQYPRRL